MIRLQKLIPRTQISLGSRTSLLPTARRFATSSSQIPTLKNALGSSQSPFLRAQAGSPVAWQEWSPEILNLASTFNRPIFLAIGYAASHWCRVMNHESFSDPAIADLINANFVPVRVDRDERRDVDLLYSMYYEATTGQTGWPLNVFLDPNSLAPFFGGMYWPSAASVERLASTNPQVAAPASLESVLSGVSTTWASSGDKCVESANAIKERLLELYRLQNGSEKADLSLSVFEDVWNHFDDSFDLNYGGFSQAPKFLCPHNLSFMLKYSHLLTPPPEVRAQQPEWKHKHDLDAKGMASFTLESIGKGATKDQIGLGFHHYSVTDDWSLPHFEKLLIDQALILSAYMYAYQADPQKNAFSLEYIRDLVDYMSTSTSEGGLLTPDGGLVASIFPDSKPIAGAHHRDADELASAAAQHSYPLVEGAYYVWQADDFSRALPKRTESDLAGAYYNVREGGNINEQFDVRHKLAYQNTLYRSMDFEELGRYFGMPASRAEKQIKEANAKLRKYRRETRDHPEVDQRAFAGWNGAAINSLAHTALALLKTPTKEGLETDELVSLGQKALGTAETIAQFVYDKLFDPKKATLQRYYLDGKASSTPGMNDDYAYMIQGLISLYTATFDTRYLDFAKRLQDAQLVNFWDTERGAFFYSDATLASNSHLFLRFKQSFDAAEPSSNGVSAENLLKLSGLLHDTFYCSKVGEIVACYAKDIAAQPFGYCSMLGAVAARLRETSSSGALTSVIVVGGENESDQDDLALHNVRQKLYDIFAKTETPGAEVEEKAIDNASSNDAVVRVSSIVPTLTILRLRSSDVERYFEPYGNALYGALADKYSTGPVHYIVSRNFTLTDPVSSLEDVVELLFKSK
ncbi:uncharacterized protein SAPINGB_P001299 [Magnusiomyces paraingens]|uniref:Spermatogenesis-associated protein 20-like TRX domain-containing protein n=1 Tax=Magnusiomyces paraingens TaxID=2606893 RepID=A0A5E8B4Z7_9ASCO|nr:uncharacterized protein SAPINGB_P001299 [Saprochaete ingens]VVT46610.1 unnamed protein product [Saprochaete ingens]